MNMSPTNSEMMEKSQWTLSWQAEELIACFDRALRSNQPIAFDDPIASLPFSERPIVITELACIELEYQFENGERPHRSRFIEDYPATFSTISLRVEVAKEHYRLLRLHRANIEPAEVAARYGVESEDWTELPVGVFCPSDFPPTGSEFCHYPLLAELGEGALGRVYLARQPDLAGRLVVLKITRRPTGEAAELARLQHSGIIPVYSIHQYRNLYAICMPYLGAITLAHLIRDGRVFRRKTCESVQECRQLASTLVSERLSTIASTLQSLPDDTHGDGVSLQPHVHGTCDVADTDLRSSEAEESIPQQLGLDELAESLCTRYLSQKPCLANFELMLGITQAVAYAHQHKIVHHDLKPENILIANNGSPVLLDFNLAKSSSRAAIDAGGTLPYMSAQHLGTFLGSYHSDPKDDVFSLGVIFYQMFTGKLPYPGNDPSHIQEMIALRKKPATSTRVYDGRISRGIDAIILKCLAYQSSDRYASAVELEEDLQRIASNRPPKYAPDCSPIERLQRWGRRHPILSSNVSLASIAAIVFVLITAALFSTQRQAHRLEVGRQVQSLCADLPETMLLLQSPGLEPELLESGIQRGERLLGDLDFSHLESVSTPSVLGVLVSDLPTEDRERLPHQIGMLYYAMAGAQARLVAIEPSVPNARLLKAKQWSKNSARLSTELSVPSSIQLKKIACLEQGTESQSLDEAPDTLATTYGKLRLAFEQGPSDRLLELADQMISESPTDPSNWFSLATAQLTCGRLSEAVRSMDVSVRLQPKSTAAKFWRGVLRLKSLDYAGAKRDFSDCLTQNEDFVAARYNRALSSWHLGDLSIARLDLDWIVDRKLATPRILGLRSQVWQSMGDLEKAAQDLEAALRSPCLTADDWVARGVLKMPSNPKEALSDFKKALQLEKNHVAAQFNSAHVYGERLGDPLKAIDSLSSLVESGHGSVSVYASRGILFARLGEVECAKKDAKSAESLDPSGLEMLQISGIYSLVAKDESEVKLAATWLARSLAADANLKEIAMTDPDLKKLREQPNFVRWIGE